MKVTITATATHYHAFKATVEVDVPDFIANNADAMELAARAYVKAHKDELPWVHDNNVLIRKKVDTVLYEVNGEKSETLSPPD